MISPQLSAWVAGALLLFWVVGAYNRLVGLRGAIIRAFGPVDRELTARRKLLETHIELVGAALANAGERIEALDAANQQVEMARVHARAHPGAPGAIKSLRVADDILAEARARLPVQAAGGTDISELKAQLDASDTALEFARRQFNQAVQQYNHAVRQLPTRLIAALFGFAPAGTL